MTIASQIRLFTTDDAFGCVTFINADFIAPYRSAENKT